MKSRDAEPCLYFRGHSQDCQCAAGVAVLLPLQTDNKIHRRYRPMNNSIQPRKSASLVEQIEARRKLIFAQYSDLFLTEDKRMRNYYQANYARIPGYHFPDHFFEIPFWIPTLSGMVDPAAYVKELFISKGAKDVIDRALKEDKETIFCFSVMEANVQHVLDFCSQVTENKIILGGYVSPTLFSRPLDSHTVGDG